MPSRQCSCSAIAGNVTITENELSEHALDSGVFVAESRGTSILNNSFGGSHPVPDVWLLDTTSDDVGVQPANVVEWVPTSR